MAKWVQFLSTGMTCVFLLGCDGSGDGEDGHHAVAAKEDYVKDLSAQSAEGEESPSAIVDGQVEDTALATSVFSGLDASVIPMPKRPASQLKAISHKDAWTTPLQLARFHAGQFPEKTKTKHLNAAAKALVHAGEFESATELALLLPDRSADQVLQQVVRNAATKGNSVDSGWLLKVARWIRNPEARAFATLEVATMLATSDAPEAALDLIREAMGLIKKRPRIGVLSEVALALMLVDKKERALETARLALSLVRAKKSDILYSSSYRRIGQVFVRAGELQEVRRLPKSGGGLFAQATAGSLRVDLAVMMADEGELSSSLEWIGQFPLGDTPKKQNKEEAYGKIAISLARQGDLKQAVQVMNLASQQLSISLSTANMKGEMAIAMASAGKVQEALKYSRQRGVGNREVLLAIAAAQMEAGQKAEAQKTVARAQDAGGGVLGFMSREHESLQAVAMAYINTGQKELAVETLQKAVAQANDYKETKYSRRKKELVVAERLLKMLPTIAMAGDQKQTEDTLQRAITLLTKVSGLSKAAATLVELGMFQRALKIAEMIQEPARKRAAILAMVRSLTRASGAHMVRTGRTAPLALKKEFSDAELAFAKQLVNAVVSSSSNTETTARPPVKKLTPAQAAEVMAWEIGKWEITGQGKPAGEQPRPIKMTMEARWKIEGKALKYKFTVQEGGKTVNYFGHQEYDADRGIFVYRSKWGNNPETTSHSRHNLATSTSRAQSVPTDRTLKKRLGRPKKGPSTSSLHGEKEAT